MHGRRFDYICAGLQRFTEDLLVQWTANAVKKTGVHDVLAAGGVFMNVKANKRIAELPEVDSFEAFPSCGDETLPLGAFYLEAAQRFGDAGVEPISRLLSGRRHRRRRGAGRHCASRASSSERREDMADAMAELLGRGSARGALRGPHGVRRRALGNRSILADPSNQDVVRVINQMVKKRDFWMPFAPMVMEERQHDYLENPKNLRSPYMMMTFDTKENFRELIAAVHNADLTCRAQSARQSRTPSCTRFSTRSSDGPAAACSSTRRSTCTAFRSCARRTTRSRSCETRASSICRSATTWCTSREAVVVVRAVVMMAN